VKRKGSIDVINKNIQKKVGEPGDDERRLGKGLRAQDYSFLGRAIDLTTFLKRRAITGTTMTTFDPHQKKERGSGDGLEGVTERVKGVEVRVQIR